jgi:hypothetical protein
VAARADASEPPVRFVSAVTTLDIEPATEVRDMPGGLRRGPRSDRLAAVRLRSRDGRAAQ